MRPQVSDFLIIMYEHEITGNRLAFLQQLDGEVALRHPAHFGEDFVFVEDGNLESGKASESEGAERTKEQDVLTRRLLRSRALQVVVQEFRRDIARLLDASANARENT